MSLISTLKRRLYPIYRKYFSRAYLYEGVLKTGKGSLRCLFVDNDKFYQQVLQKLFMDSPTLIRSFRCWMPGLKRMIKSPGLDAEICIANVSLKYGHLLRDCATFKMQTRVTQKIYIANGLETNKCYRDRRRDEGRVIRKFGLTCRISHSLDDFDFFYHRMSRPLIRKFGDAVIVDTYEEMKQIFEKGVLILVHYKGEPISGVLCYENQGVFTAYRSGLLDGEQSYLKMGAMSAWYYFLLEYAIQQGFQEVNFMQSLPILNDGVYLHKQHWGAKTVPFEGAQSKVYLFNRSSSEILARVIETIPLIVHTGNGLEGVVSIPDEQVLTPEFEKKISQQYSAPGLVGLHMLRPHGPAEHIAFVEHS